MNDLAAAAYEAEQEHVDTSLEVRDALGVRDLMLRLAKLEQDAAALRELRDQVLDRYDQRLKGMADESEQIRGSIEAFILHVNGGEKVSIPDAGTAYLTTKNKGGKLKVTDAAALEAALENLRIDVPRKPGAFDVQRALELFADECDIHAHPSGQIVTSDGELIDELDGVIAEPETKSLALRKAV